MRLVKIEEAYQKEVFQEETLQGEASQEVMVAPIDNATTQKIFKAIEEQNDVLKKKGGHLTKLEENKLKKSIRVDIHDEDERKDWDERDKAEYERNEQFEKLTTISVAMKEKMDKKQQAFHYALGMDDCFYNMGGISSKTPMELPPKFKISNAKKFDRTRDLKQHVRRYLSIAEMKG